MFNPDKPVRTRDGRKARIICVDRRGGFHPIVALREDRHGEELISVHALTGRCYAIRESQDDLINIEEGEDG
jgi:hypothetical protein